VADPKGEEPRIRREVRKRNALKKIIKAVKSLLGLFLKLFNANTLCHCGGMIYLFVFSTA
jgi:hypothetical protein